MFLYAQISLTCKKYCLRFWFIHLLFQPQYQSLDYEKYLTRKISSRYIFLLLCYIFQFRGRGRLWQTCFWDGKGNLFCEKLDSWLKTTLFLTRHKRKTFNLLNFLFVCIADIKLRPILLIAPITKKQSQGIKSFALASTEDQD